MLKRNFVCTIAIMMILGVGLTGCKKKKETPASSTDMATQTDLSTTTETTAKSTAAETEIIEETNEKGEKQTVAKTKVQGNSGSGKNNSGQKAKPAPQATTAKPATKATTAKPSRTWSYQSGLSASIESAINSYRVSQGQQALPVSGSCRSKSKTRAEYNAANERTGHEGGQISYCGTKSSASAILAAWKASKGHNDNILDDLPISIGAAAYKDSNGTIEVVVTFGF